MNRFINFSNHPLKNWCDKQIEEANTYGEVIDMEFPAVDADRNEEEIALLADRCVDEIMKYEPAVVMCQGEFTLSYAIINRLKNKNIKVVAACSQRQTKEIGNKKISEFNFVRFREYN